MAQWGGTNNVSSFNATTHAKGMMDERSASRGGITDFKLSSGGENGLVGMNGAKVDDVVQAINNYIRRVRDIQSQNTELMKKFEAALFDEQMKSAYDNYVLKVDGYVQNLVS